MECLTSLEEQQKKFLENLKDIGPKPMEIGGAKEVQSN